MKGRQLPLQLAASQHKIPSGAELHWQHLPVDTNGAFIAWQIEPVSRSDPQPSQLSLNLPNNSLPCWAAPMQWHWLLLSSLLQGDLC